MKIGLGTAQFGLPYGISNSSGLVAPDAARLILARARAAGIDMLDTAAGYGVAEAVLGELIGAEPAFRIVTKTVRLSAGLDALIARARRSANMLGRPGVDALLVHVASDLDGSRGDRLWQALLRLRDEGLFGRIGISVYADDDIAGLVRRFAPAVVQVPVSVLDQRLVADGTLASLKRQGIEVHARSLFLQGLIFLDTEQLPRKLAAIGPRLADIRRRIDAAGTTPLAAAIAFASICGGIDVAIVGVTCSSELDEITRAAVAPVPALDWSSLALDDRLALTPTLW